MPRPAAAGTGTLRLALRFGRRFGRSHQAIAIDGVLTEGNEGFPLQALRVGYPSFVRAGIAAMGFTLVEDVATGGRQAIGDFAQFVAAFDLDAEMVEAFRIAAGRDGKIHPR